MNVAVVYLNREPDGTRRFVRGYADHAPGLEHTLVLLNKGAAATALPFVTVVGLGGVVEVDEGVTDLQAYHYAALVLCSFSILVFMNSKTVVHGRGWLLELVSPLVVNPKIGMSGAFHSYESFYSNRPSWWRRLFFRPSPNFHIRTNCFAIRREVMLKVWPRWLFTKKLCYLAESGRCSITRRIESMGMDVVSVPTAVLSDNRSTNVPGSWKS